MTATEKLPGRVNYLIGDRRERWETNVPIYRTVVYRNVWRGIDMRVRGASGVLEYEFLVDPGARVSDIRLAYRGVKGLSLSRGALLVRTALGVLRDSAPVTCQRVDGTRVRVSSRYAVSRSRTEYRFVVGGYDMRRPLVIDPGLVYSSYLGGHGGEGGFNAVSVDPRGNVYVAGCTGASDYPTTPGSFQPIDPGPAGEEAVITKLSKDGSTLVYSTYLGRSRSVDQISDVVVEKGFAHGGGTTNSQNFPTTPGTIEPADPDPLPGAAARDYFVAKLQTEPAVPTPQRGGADLRGRPAAAPHTSTRAPRPTAGA